MDCSILQKLPPELRCQVYDYVCFEQGGIDIIRSKIHGPRPKLPLQSQGLLSSCRQIRNESLASFCIVNSFHFRTDLLGPNFKLVRGQRICSSNVTGTVEDVQTLLRNTALPVRTIEIDLGVWYTWWERTDPDIVAAIVGRIAASGFSTSRRLKVRFAVEWCAVPAVKSKFEIVLHLPDLGEGRHIVQEELRERDEWVASQFERHCMQANLTTCRRKLKELFDILSTHLRPTAQ